jgi:hypothetical protein
MFKAVRGSFRGRRLQRTARLFAFEFVVVVAGVLVAQGLADWVRDRTDRADGRRLAVEATDQARGYQRSLNFWAKFGPCVRSHVADIARAASTGRSLTAVEIGRPALPSGDAGAFDSEDWRKIRQVVPKDRADALLVIDRTVQTYNDFISDTARQWALFRVIDSSVGRPSDEDRSRVRQAAAIIDNNIRWMMFQHATGSTGNMKSTGIGRYVEMPKSAQFVDRCGLLKDWR